MEILRELEPNFRQRFAELLERRNQDPQVEQAAAEILAGVRARGDAAVAEYAKKFDRVTLTPAEFAVSAKEIAAAEKAVDASAKAAIRMACAQIRDFAQQQKRQDWSFSPRPGVRLGERFTPLSRVGAYVPGGTAPLVSTVLHTVTLAKVAGVKEIVVVTPPGADKKVHPAILFAAKVAGATTVYRLGGVYAVGALAYGTQTIPRVEKIVGPGNAYVTAAKRQVYGEVALDLVAGPSEILVLADSTANPEFIAADMLSQAEHGSGREQVFLITTDAKLVPKVQAALARQAKTLSRLACVQKVLKAGVFFIVAKNTASAVVLADQIAPEHLEIMMRSPERVAAKIQAAGAIFIGHWTPEPVGDFVAGPSHVLPTAGAGRYFSGLTLEHFYRRMSTVSYTEAALRREVGAIAKFAELEGLDAHGRSATIRLEPPKRNGKKHIA